MHMRAAASLSRECAVEISPHIFVLVNYKEKPFVYIALSSYMVTVNLYTSNFQSLAKYKKKIKYNLLSF